MMSLSQVAVVDMDQPEEGSTCGATRGWAEAKVGGDLAQVSAGICGRCHLQSLQTVRIGMSQMCLLRSILYLNSSVSF